MRDIQASIEPEEVADYEFATPDGPVRLSGLFGDKRDLIVILNMGASCPACTLWADGYSGLYPHIAQRAAFVVSSPDVPEVQQRFAASRGWRFPMVSHAETSFAGDMGYRSGVPARWCARCSCFRHGVAAGRRLLRAVALPRHASGRSGRLEAALQLWVRGFT